MAASRNARLSLGGLPGDVVAGAAEAWSPGVPVVAQPVRIKADDKTVTSMLHERMRDVKLEWVFVLRGILVIRPVTCESGSACQSGQALNLILQLIHQEMINYNSPAFLPLSIEAEACLEWPMKRETWRQSLRQMVKNGQAALVHPLSPWVMGGVGMGLVLGIVILVFWRAPTSLVEESSQIIFFQIGTGPSDGAYFAWGGRLAAVISRPPGVGRCEPGGPCGVDGVLAVVKSSSGSVANIRAVSTHHIQSALVQSVVLAQATKGTGAFRGEKPNTSLRAIANIHRETVHLVASRGAVITSPSDLKGRRLSIGVKGSGTEYVALALLKAYGLSRKSVDISYSEPERAADMMLRGQLDAFVYVASDPSTFISDLADRGTIDIVPINGPQVEELVTQHPELTNVLISEETYRFNPAVQTVAVGTIWVVDASENAALIYGLTKSLFYTGNRNLLPMQQFQSFVPIQRSKEGEATERERLMRQSLQNLTIPLHPGAEQFYRQENMMQAEPVMVTP